MKTHTHTQTHTYTHTHTGAHADTHTHNINTCARTQTQIQSRTHVSLQALRVLSRTLTFKLSGGSTASAARASLPHSNVWSTSSQPDHKQCSRRRIESWSRRWLGKRRNPEYPQPGNAKGRRCWANKLDQSFQSETNNTHT